MTQWQNDVEILTAEIARVAGELERICAEQTLRAEKVEKAEAETNDMMTIATLENEELKARCGRYREVLKRIAGSGITHFLSHSSLVKIAKKALEVKP